MPRTFYTYDDQGRVSSSWVESGWDDYERALLRAYQSWKADQCPGCDRPLSESLRVAGRPDPEYVVGTYVCCGCLELDAHRANRAKADEKSHEDGRHPDLARRDTVYTRAEARALEKAQHGRR